LKHFLIYIVFFSIFISCKEKETPKIEIYLTKEIIKNSSGIPIEKFVENHPNKEEILKYNGNKNFSVDTITGNIICCSNFKIDKKNLKNKPFIMDDEIKGFNFQYSSITLSKSALKKLLSLTSNSSKQQFSICINGEPKMNGYFMGIMSKYPSENYSFMYSYAFDKNNLKFDSYDFWLRYGNNMRDLDSINENEFYEVLKETNRILK